MGNDEQKSNKNASRVSYHHRIAPPAPAEPALRPLTTDATPADLAEVLPPDLVARASDLRRNHRRDLVERVLRRSHALPPVERALVEGVYLREATTVQLGRETNRTARQVRRTVRDAVRRALSPLFGFVVDHRDCWTGARARVARLCLLEGHSQREAARSLRLSHHAVRRHLDAIRLMHEAYESQRRRAS